MLRQILIAVSLLLISASVTAMLKEHYRTPVAIAIGFSGVLLLVATLTWNLGGAPVVQTPPPTSPAPSITTTPPPATPDRDSHNILVQGSQNVIIDNSTAKQVTVNSSDIADLAKRVAENMTGGHDEPSAPGLQVCFFLGLGARVPDRDNFIFDARDTHGTRVSLYLDPQGTMFLRVLDGTRSDEIHVAPGLDTGLIFGNLVQVTLAYGSTPSYSFLRLVINGKEVGYGRKIPALRAPVSDMDVVFGADIERRNGSVISVGLMTVYSGTLSLTDEKINFGIMNNIYAAKSPAGPFVSFDGTQSFAGHVGGRPKD